MFIHANGSRDMHDFINTDSASALKIVWVTIQCIFKLITKSPSTFPPELCQNYSSAQ